ncbi:MAG: hypothetical protein GF364_09330 [Candidatus Lokiarchaeota archaeon]|nr:hypothetical protein [Candidatus Lokiarchaeota archaeon]
MSIIQEITGEKLQTIGVRGVYIKIYQRNNYKLISFSKKHPRWMRDNIKTTLRDINKKYGTYFEEFNGVTKEVTIKGIVKKHFGSRNLLIQESNFRM